MTRALSLLAALALACSVSVPAFAQQSSAVVVAACGTPPAAYPAGANRALTQDTDGQLCTEGTGGGGTSDVNIAEIGGAAVGTTSPLYTAPVPEDAAGVAITPSVTVAAASNLVAKASAGNLYSAYCQSGTAGFCMVFNATSLPMDGAVTPLHCVPVAAGSFAAIDFGQLPERYSTGITIGYSTGANCFTLTASATAFIRARSQ